MNQGTQDNNEEVTKIFEQVTRNWAGIMMLFPHKCRDGAYKNIVIKAADILEIIRRAIEETETKSA